MLFSFHAIHPANSFMGDLTPSGSMPDGCLLRVVFVSNIFLIGCSSFLGLSAISFPTTPPWLGLKANVIWCLLSWRAARRSRMSLSSAFLRGIAGWRFAIRSRTDLVSLTIQTFWGDFSVWIICNSFLIAFILKGQTPCAGWYGIRMVTCRITLVASGEHDASSAYFCTVPSRIIRVDG